MKLADEKRKSAKRIPGKTGTKASLSKTPNLDPNPHNPNENIGRNQHNHPRRKGNRHSERKRKTMIKLLLGYSPVAEITIGSTDLQKYNLKWWRKRMRSGHAGRSCSRTHNTVG